MTESSGNKQRDLKKNLGILFVVAGCPGSGKSTIIKSTYEKTYQYLGRSITKNT